MTLSIDANHILDCGLQVLDGRLGLICKEKTRPGLFGTEREDFVSSTEIFKGTEVPNTH